MKFKEAHECSFTIRNIDVLFPLPPNATLSAKFKRAIRAFCSMDPKSVKSREFFRNKSTMFAEQKRHAQKAYRFVIHPFSKMNRFLKMIFFFSWLWHYFGVAVVSGFVNHPAIYIIGLIMDISQTIVFVSFFFLGYVDKKRREIILEPKRILLHYMTTYFIIDLTAIFYGVVVEAFLDKNKLLFEQYPQNFVVTVVSSAAYFVRYKYFLAILRNATTSIRLSKQIFTVCYHVISTSLILHMFTCSVFSIPRLFSGVNFSPKSWLRQANILSLDKVYFPDLYVESLVLTVCFFFGVSFDKYVIEQPEEEIVLTVISVFGRLYTLYMIADILNTFGLVSVSESEYEQILGQLEEYMISKNLPDDLRIKLVKFYEYKLQKNYFNEGQLLKVLSEYLKTEIYLYGARKLIERAKVLKSLPKTTLSALFALMKSETFLQMDVITRAGSKVENVYFISAGTVAVMNPENIELAHLEDGEEFGFLVSRDGKQLFTHVAVETSEVFYISKKVLVDFLEQYPAIMKYFLFRNRKMIEKYQSMGNLVLSGNDVLSTLRAGSLLESQKIRIMDFDFSH